MYRILTFLNGKNKYNILFHYIFYQSYTKLKDALRVCAAFRGKYLDYRDKANEINEFNRREHADNL